MQAADEQRWNAGINGQVVVGVELGTGPPCHLGAVGGNGESWAGAGQGRNADCWVWLPSGV